MSPQLAPLEQSSWLEGAFARGDSPRGAVAGDTGPWTGLAGCTAEGSRAVPASRPGVWCHGTHGRSWAAGPAAAVVTAAPGELGPGRDPSSSSRVTSAATSLLI